MSGINSGQEAKSLRWLAFNFPKVENPQTESDKLSNCIHLYSSAAADRIDQLERELEIVKAERDSYAAEVKEVIDHGMCGICQNYNEELCITCNFKWRGDKNNDKM